MADEQAAPRSVEELEERLTRASPALVEALAGLAGDLVVLGAGGKMGPSLAILAVRALREAGSRARVWCVSRFEAGDAAERLERAGCRVVRCDLLAPGAFDTLPSAGNVLYLVGRKFGASQDPDLTWALNSFLPGLAARRYHDARMVALSTGNVYPLVPPDSGGATEETPPAPVGEYAWSCLGRERVLAHASRQLGTRMLLVRLNYATDLRYGVLVDLAQRVRTGQPVDLRMGWFNTLWQGDANEALLRGLALCESPARLLNVTGPETLSVRQAASDLAERMGCPPPIFEGEAAPVALLSDAARCRHLLGPPRVAADTLLQWTAEWVSRGLPTLQKPTRFEVADGQF